MSSTVSQRVEHLPAVAVTSGGPHFFGYYDKCPWSADGRQLLAMRATFQDRPPTEADVLTIGVVDLETKQFREIGETTAWCWQQGTMLQWLPGGEVIYNTRGADGQLRSVIRNPATGTKRELSRPIYCVHPNGLEAISLDFHRLQTLRPGYGYPPGVEITPHNLAPEDVGLWRVDLQSGKSDLIFSIADGRRFEHDPRSDAVPNWFNHATYNPDGSRFCFLHRFKDLKGPAGPWQTRFFTLRSDGSDPFLLNGMGMTSHYAWRDPQHVIAWTWQQRAGQREAGYWVLKDQSRESELIGNGVLVKDGHMTYSPDGRWLLTDEYPGPDGGQPLLLFNLQTGQRIEIGRFKAPLSGEIRCDLHPRFNRDGTQVCFDSAHDGTRQVYVVDVSEVVCQ